MKSNVLKSLSASAFALAIVASFAFSANNFAISEYTEEGSVWLNTSPICTDIDNIECYTNPFANDCTKFILGQGVLDVYEKGTSCSLRLGLLPE